MQFDRTKFSDCSGCPLRENRRVWGQSRGSSAPLALVGEAPGEEEAQEGKPFVGRTGKLLQTAFRMEGGVWDRTYVTNVISCRPPRNDIGGIEGELAKDCCKKGFLAELAWLAGKGLKAVGAVGAVAAQALGVPGTLTKQRGFVHLAEIAGKPFPVVPTYHPSYIARGNFHEEVTWRCDLGKMLDLTVGESYRPPREDFLLRPSLTQLKSFLHGILNRKNALIGVDIETCRGQIYCVGIATGKSKAICVPFYRQGMVPYWPKEQEEQVKRLLREVLLSTDTVFQNALFDVSWLERFGYPVGKIRHDVMLAHHVLHPELPHRLDYIVSIYGTTPSWKGAVLDDIKDLSLQEDTNVWTYNSRDSVVLHQVLDPILKELKEGNLLRIYENFSMKLIRPILAATDNGIPISAKALEKFKRDLDKMLVDLDGSLRSCGIAPSFNFNSGDDMRYLLFGEEPEKYRRVLEELSSYETEGCKKRKDTKKYADFIAVKEAIQGTKPLVLPRVSKGSTDGGKTATDSSTVLRITRAVTRELAEEAEKKKPKQDYIEELRRSLKVVGDFSSRQTYEKLRSTYTNFRIGTDNRIHGNFLIHGTASGRLSSREPNLQNIPEEAKVVFVAPEKFSFVQADYSNLELRVLAYLSGDTVLMDMFQKGLNVHSENCKAMFGLDETAPSWNAARKACKIYIFGRNYGGSVEGIYRQVLEAVPELGLTLAQFKKVDEQYRKAHPKYNKWRDETIKEVRATRTLTNAFGRRRIFLGMVDEIEREGLNFPIQSTAAEIFNQGLINFYSLELPKLPKVELSAFVHDSILCLSPDALIDKTAKALKKSMEAELTVMGKKRRFPVDFKVGKSWGDLHEYPAKT